MGLWQLIGEDMRWYARIVGSRHPIVALADRHFWLVASYRLGHWGRTCRIPGWGHLVRFLYGVLNFFVSTVAAGDIRPGAVIGRRFSVHTARGLLITNGVQIGDDVMVNNGVCLVYRANNRGGGVPRVGNDVRLGIGCKVLGDVTVGSHVIVGANAVVIHDVPDFHMALGVPAKNKPRPDPDQPANPAPPQP